jgi:eukaryotic-like serine/threonine-protein kinase
MPGVDWHRVKEVLGAALDESPERRSALLDEACANDATLRAEVESLLRAHADAGTFIEQPALARRESLDDHDPYIGLVLGPYSIDRCIGRGGMGAVYLARRTDKEFERLVAIKMIRRGMDSDLVVRRFRHERQILASLDHPHIASLFDGGSTPEGLPYFVMEHVEGIPIDRYADEHCLSTAERVKLCLGVIDAVQHAHDRHIVHRDLKPSNVLVTADSHPKLLDFGIAKILDPAAEGDSTLTSLARPMTPDYASPEQVRGEPVTPATDVYALGLLLYELLTGHRPYRLTTRTPDEIQRVVCEQDPERPSAVVSQTASTILADGTTLVRTPAMVSRTRDGSPDLLRQRLHGALDDIVLKALRKDPAGRYSSVAELADDLRRYLADQPVSAGRDALRYRVTRLARRHRVALGSAALVIAAIAITALVVRTVMPQQLPASGASATASQAHAARPSVAVVGFRNLSQRPSDEWLSTAMAEMLTTELAGDGQVRVLPPERVAVAERDLGTSATAALTADAIERLRTTLATDYIVVGTFATSEQASPRSLRIDVRVHRASADPIAVAGVGDEAGLFTMIAAAGRELRTHLGLKSTTPEATNAARAAFPQSVDATRLYAEGMTRLRQLDAMGAREMLEKAAALEPANPLVQTALASAWTALGYDARAGETAQKALDASGGLNREDRLFVEGRVYEAQRKWPKAVDVYRTLWGFFSDNAEYGLRLAAAQTAAGQGKDSLVTLDTIRQLPAPQSADPRIDLAEAQAAVTLGDYKRELAAIQRAIQGAEQQGSRLLLGRAKLLEGRNVLNLGQPERALQALEVARKIYTDVGDKAALSIALNSLAAVLDDRGKIPEAVRMYRESFAISEAIGDRRGMSAALNNLGILLKDERRFGEALEAHERALAIRREIDDKNWIAVSLSNIGVVYFEQDRFGDATKYYKESLELCRTIGDRRGEIRALHNLAIIDNETGHLAAARAGYEESIAKRAAIGDVRGAVAARVQLGSVLLAQGEIEAARREQSEALTLARSAQMKSGEAFALYQLAQIDLTMGDLAAARTKHMEALAMRRELKETRTVLESEAALAELAFEEGRPADAERDAVKIIAAIGEAPAGYMRIWVELVAARARLALGNVEGAERALGTARQLAEKTQRIDTRRMLMMVEAEMDAARGRIDRARTRLGELRTSLSQAGMVLADLESRMLLLRLDRAQNKPSVRADARALEEDARARRAGLIVRRVQAL